MGIDVVTFYFLFTLDCCNITSANRSEDQYLRPIGVKNTSQAAQTSPMSEFTLLCTPNVKAGDLKTPHYYLFQGQDHKNIFLTLKYIHGSVDFMQKVLLSPSGTMIKHHLFKKYSVRPSQSLLCRKLCMTYFVDRLHGLWPYAISTKLCGSALR